MAADVSSLHEPIYPGDGLYAEFDNWQIHLYAHNGFSHTDEVFLEPDVLVAFLRCVEKLKGGSVAAG